MVSLCSSVNFLYDRVDFTRHHMIYGKILDETYNICAKNDQNDQKLRHYDVITHEKISFEKISIFFSEFSHNSLQYRLGRFFMKYNF